MEEYSSEYRSNKRSAEKTALPSIITPERRLRTILRGHLTNEVNGILFYSKYIFPYVRREKNGEILGEDSMMNIKIVNSGGFGLALRCENILIKVFKYENSHKCIARELKNIYQVYYDNDKRVKIPPQINSFIGVITNEKDLTQNIKQIKNKIYEDCSFYTSMYENRFSKKELISNATKRRLPDSVNKRYKEYEKTEITTILLECEEYESLDYVNKFINKNNVNAFLFDFINDMYTALVFLHVKRNIIHNDIKYENIVTSYDKKLGRYVFKIIDFGLSRKVDKIDEIFHHKKPKGTPLLFNGTVFEHNRSFLYDWHCLFVTIFDLCLLTRSDDPSEKKKVSMGSIGMESNEDFSFHAESEEEILYFPSEINGEWIRANSLTDENTSKYMDFVHKKYLPTVDKSLIAFIKSIMKFQYYMDDKGSYLINIDELIEELYQSFPSK